MSVAFRGRVAVGLVALVVGTPFVTSCSSSSSSPTFANPAAAAAAATLAGKSAKIEGDVTFTARPAQPLVGAWQGTVKKPATAEGFVNTKLPLGPSEASPVEARWIGSTLYIKRAIGTGANASGSLGSFIRDKSAKPWSSGTLGPLVNLFALQPFQPVELLQMMASGGAQQLHGNENIDGVNTTHLRTKQPVPVLGWWSNVTVDVWVDGHHRAVQVQLSSSSGGTKYVVRDYGSSVNVQPPPANAIDHPGKPKPVALTGPYTTAASGSWNGMAWSMLKAPATNGQVCYRWEATPPITQTVTDGPDGARCLTPPTAGADPVDTISFPIDGNGDGPYDALGVLLPNGVRSLTLGFVGGKTQTVPVTSPFVWIGPSSSTPGYLGVVLADGTKIDCGAGAISGVADLTDEQLTARAASAPWACTSASGN